MSEVKVTKSPAPAVAAPPVTTPSLFNLSPFALMREFAQEMERSFTGTPFWDKGGSFFNSPLFKNGEWMPAIECRKDNGNFIVTAEVPGMGKDDLKVQLLEDELILEGEKKEEKKEEKEGMFRSERRYGKFYRSIPLPAGAKMEEIKASLDGGVLKVSLPVVESKPKTVPVATK